MLSVVLSQGVLVSVSALADLVLRDPVLAQAMSDAREESAPALDLTGPPALRPFVVKGLVDAGRTVLAVAATARACHSQRGS